MTPDADLLRRYVDTRAEAAFAELVRRHLDLVYFAALRQVGGDTHRAKDVAQAVFTDLARKAAQLTAHATLVGWLHTSVRFAAAKVRRAELTRQHREQEATAMSELLHDPNAAAEWERLRPMIDDAVHELDERDREAVLLRFFQNRPFAEIGTALRVSEDAARMRVDRALDKLRTRLARRGVTSTSAALAVVFAQQAGAAAPVGLASAIASAAFASGALGSVAGVAAVAGAGVFMSKTTVIVSVVALAAIGSALWQWNRAQGAEAERTAAALERDALRTQLTAERQRGDRSTQELAALQGDFDKLKTAQAALPAAPVSSPSAAAATPARAPASVTLGMARWEIQQATLGNLRQIDAARKQYLLEKKQQAGSIKDLVGRGSFIKTVRSVDGEDYVNLSMNPAEPLTVTTAGGVAVTFDPSGATTTKPDFPPEIVRLNEMTARVQPTIKPALDAYRAANGGKMPPDERALIPYFATPKEGADYVEALDAKKAAGL